MLSVSPISAAGAQGMAGYLENESSAAEDYYAGENDTGKWVSGDLAQTLGLEGELKRGQLLKMLQGYHPETGEPLAKNAGLAHKAGWDLTYSAPKSVSAVWAVAPRELRQAIEAAQAHAATEGLQFIQEQGGFSSRSRQNPEAVKILAAQFQHGTSRAMDPDLHTHTVVANLCKTREGFLAVDFDTRWKMASGAVYRAALASKLQELGFSIARDGSSFKVAGVPDELCKTWSKRRNQIQAALAAQGREGTAQEASVATLATREKKQKVSREELFFSWRQQAAEHGLAAEELRNLQAEGRGAEPTPDPDSLDPLSDEALLASLTEHESVFTRQRVFQEVATAAQGRLDKAGIEARVTQLLASQELMKLRARPSQGADSRRERLQPFTTKEMWQLEAGLAKRGLDLSLRQEMVVAPDISRQAIRKFEEAKGFSLSEEQKAAVQHVVSETGQIALVRGAAGAGKTTMLEAAKGAWASAGYRVRGAALAGKAAAGLQAVGIQSQTIASLLLAPNQLARAREFHENAWSPAARQKAEERVAELEAAQLRKGDVLVVDEAGMVGSRQMAELAKRCEEAGAKLVLVGDEKQLQAISAGGAFAMLQNNLGFVSLSENRRQRQAADQAAAQSVVNGEALGAIQSYADRGLLKVENSKEKLKSDLVSDYLSSSAGDQDKLILTQTRADAADLNSLIHDAKLADGLVINSQSLAAAKGDIDLAEGDRFIFLQNDKRLGISNANLGTVKRIEFSENGMKVTVIPDAGQGAPASVSFLVGDPADKSFSREAALPVYNQFDLGYAATTHKGQGASIPETFVLGLGDREMSYVQLTRHKDSCRLYCQSDALESLLPEPDAPDSNEPSSVLSRLKNAVSTMEKSHQKQTSQDFEQEDIGPEQDLEKSKGLESESGQNAETPTNVMPNSSVSVPLSPASELSLELGMEAGVSDGGGEE